MHPGCSREVLHKIPGQARPCLAHEITAQGADPPPHLSTAGTQSLPAAHSRATGFLSPPAVPQPRAPSPFPSGDREAAPGPPAPARPHIAPPTCLHVSSACPPCCLEVWAGHCATRLTPSGVEGGSEQGRELAAPARQSGWPISPARARQTSERLLEGKGKERFHLSRARQQNTLN